LITSVTKYNYRQAKQYHQDSDYSRAIEFYHKVILDLPNEASIHCNLASCYLALRSYPEAEKYYKTSLSFELDIDVLFNLACVYEKLNNDSMARDCYEKILELDSDNFSTNYNLAVLHLRNSDRISALNYFKNSQSLQPDNKKVNYHISMLTGKTEDRAPNSYVEDLFDNYADNFDSHLKSLEYKVPAEIYKLLLFDLF
jgi:tetratricopeptide (TPR) repeat protein